MSGGITWLAEGTMEYGVAKRLLPAPDGFGMAGYSVGGKRGSVGGQALEARVLALRDAGGREAALVVCDLMCPSLALYEAVARGAGIPRESLILSGTHTHSAPGHFYANPFYRVFAQPLRLGAIARADTEWIDALARGIADAILEATNALAPGAVAISQQTLFGVARNRSEECFDAHPRAAIWDHAPQPGHGAPASIHTTQKKIDARLTTIHARPTSGATSGAAFGFYACHATSLGPKQETYHRDWPGYAVDRASNAAIQPLVAVGLGAAGDVSPLPPGESEGPSQGEPLAQSVGHAVGDVIRIGVDAFVARPLPTDALELHVGGGELRPPSSLTWDVGYPILYGAEDGRTEVFGPFLREGMRRRSADPGPMNDPQWPKRSVLPLLQRLLRPHLAPSPWHPVHRLHLGEHAFFTAPGEPTGLASYELERDLMESMPNVASASVIGYAGDYAGYFTTRAEYEMQHYEGAHTLYGRASQRLWSQAVLTLPSMPAPGASLGQDDEAPLAASDGPRWVEDAALGVSVAYMGPSHADTSSGATLRIGATTHLGTVVGIDIDHAEDRWLYVARFIDVSEGVMANTGATLNAPGLEGDGVIR